MLYNRFFYNCMIGAMNLTSDTLKLALVTSSYTPDVDHNTYADVSTYEVSGTGYTTGGFTLSTVTVTQDDTNDRATLDCADIDTTSTTISGARYAIVYDVTASNNLIAYYDFGSDQSSDNGDFDITINASGLVNLQDSAT